jgi:predicted metalloendopeptidase
MNADDAFNYGAIGVVIGHEMTHGFDDQGSQFDKDGNLINWWTEEDRARFEERTKVMEEYFNGIEVAPGTFANGAFTLGENIADHGGLQVAYQAFQNAQKSAIGNGQLAIGDRRYLHGSCYGRGFIADTSGNLWGVHKPLHISHTDMVYINIAS